MEDKEVRQEHLQSSSIRRCCGCWRLETSFHAFALPWCGFSVRSSTFSDNRHSSRYALVQTHCRVAKERTNKKGFLSGNLQQYEASTNQALVPGMSAGPPRPLLDPIRHFATSTTGQTIVPSFMIYRRTPVTADAHNSHV